jgi:hypothetical protein
MDATVAAGWIGLGGAAVGASAALLGGWIQQVHQARTARAELRDQRGYEAARTALAELYVLRQHVHACEGSSVPPEREPWRKIASDHLDAAELAVLLIPNVSKARGEALGALLLAERFELAGRERWAQLGWIRECAAAAIVILSTHMRGDPVAHVPLTRLQQIVDDHDSRYEPWDGGDIGHPS